MVIPSLSGRCPHFAANMVLVVSGALPASVASIARDRALSALPVPEDSIALTPA